jgi:CSLREA domain-containing protein
MRASLLFLAALLGAALLLAPAQASPPSAPTTIAVTTLTDELNADGDCSLREAIQAANTDTPVDACPAGNGADTITLGAHLYSLSLAGAGENLNATGDLDIAGTLTIQGIDPDSTTVDAAGLGDRVFHLLPGAHVTLSGFAIKHGGTSGDTAFDGGAILIGAGAGLTLAKIDLANNVAGHFGGGIYNAGGQISASESYIRDNIAGTGGSPGNGGGIYNAAGGTVIISSTTLNNNTATGGDGGGLHNRGQISIADAWIHDNVADASGAGLYNSATAIITGTVLDANHATLDGGNIYSGALDESSQLTVSSSELREGHGRNGGGLYNHGQLSAASVSFQLNQATGAGNALYHAAPTKTASLTNATVADNGPPSGSIASALDNDGATVTLRNTLVAANGERPSCSGPFTSGGHNLDAAASCGLNGAGDLSNTNPLLAVLPTVGQHPTTYALIAGSPANNAADDANCAARDIFQRSRPHGAHCDIGAYETNSAPSAGAAETYNTNEDTPLVITAPGVLANDTDPDGDPLNATRVTWTTKGALTLNANGSFSYTPPANFYGSDAFAYRVSDGALASAVVVVTINIAPVNDVPVVQADALSIATPRPLTIAAAALLANDSDVDGDSLAITAAGSASSLGGAVTLDGTNIIYTPPLNHNGADQFSYTVSDGHGGSASATVTVAVDFRHLYLPPIYR